VRERTAPVLPHRPWPDVRTPPPGTWEAGEDVTAGRYLEACHGWLN
jgi:hypothetical protein